HKFDPITQREFYQVFAYFNNVPERGKAVKYGNSPPLIAAPTREQQARLGELQKQLADAERDFPKLGQQIDAAQRTWEKTSSDATTLQWAPTAGLVAHFALDGDTKGGKLEGHLSFVEGPLGRAGAFDGRSFVDAGDVADFGFYDKFSIAAWVYPKGTEG